MTVADPILETRELAKRYRRGVWALQGIDLEIPSGGITALVGPNAAGKSTLIKTWVGFERPTRGSVRVAGIDPWKDRSAALAHLGYVPQSPALYDGLSVEDHLDLARQLRPSFDRDYARSRLAQLDIPADRGARDLSGGQQAQVALAIALGTRAPILLLDEPLASLDPLARREFLHVLTDAVRSDGATALLSSHIVTDVEQACDRLVVLGVGKVLLHDTVADAMSAHSISSSEHPGAVASFGAPDGSRIWLVRGTGERPATLDEVVLGYLASGRSTATPAAAA
ncbi:MAG TPA: ABC transporter ATP-binding protein [Candidatus Limnocylindria bacterium]|nr:ABC transporter ATP-binding protein [Candidatus Limnocylindria bacterium]